MLVEAQKFHISGEYRKAADLFVTVVEQDDLARPALLDCLVRLEDTNTILEVFDPPASEAEAIHVMDALWTDGKQKRLAQLIKTPVIADSADPSVVELLRKYSARLK